MQFFVQLLFLMATFQYFLCRTSFLSMWYNEYVCVHLRILFIDLEISIMSNIHDNCFLSPLSIDEFVVSIPLGYVICLKTIPVWCNAQTSGHLPGYCKAYKLSIDKNIQSLIISAHSHDNKEQLYISVIWRVSVYIIKDNIKKLN